ncbi:MAG: TRAP transporter large permease [Microbacteriaceae bacterium]
MDLTVYLVLILVLLLSRVPVVYALLLPSVIYFITHGHSEGLAVRIVFQGILSYPLLAVPLFILLGVLANRSGITERLYDAAQAAIGSLRGGLAYVSVASSFMFAWMSGSALADAAALSKIQVSSMVERGYPKRFSLGLSTTSSLISPIMPPSIPAIIYASIASLSASALFAASVIPAILLTLSLFVTIYFWARKKNNLRGEPFSFAAWLRATKRVAFSLGVPIVILGGILFGFFTPTEAGAIGIIYILILGFSYGKLKLRDLPGIIAEATITTASVALIIGATNLLGWILAREKVTQAVSEFFVSMTDNPYVFLIMVNILLIILGTIMEVTPALLIVVPILMPIAAEYGVHPLQLGVLVMVNLLFGLLSPPLGSVMFVVAKATGYKVEDVMMGILPFVPSLLMNLVLLTSIPGLSLWLPQLLGLM